MRFPVNEACAGLPAAQLYLILSLDRGKISFQSSFILTKVQPLMAAASSAVSSRPKAERRSLAYSPTAST